MTRSLRIAAALAASLAVVVLAACGGSDDTYKKDAKSAVQAVSAAGAKIETTLKAANGQTDAALTTQFEALKKQTDAALQQVQDLEPPNDSDKKLVENLVTALSAADKHLGALADAASVSDAAAAQTATTELVQSSPAVATANQALGKSVGVEPATTTTTS